MSFSGISRITAAEMQKSDSASDLLRKCVAARQAGADFPGIWDTILKRHPLVFGPPVQGMEAGEARLEIPLITGQRLVYGNEGFEIG